MRRLALVLLAGLIAVSCGGGPGQLVIAAGTTVYDSGFLDRLVDLYAESGPGVDIFVSPGPTAEVLELGERGEADLLITNSPSREASFLESGAASSSAPVFASRFIMVGPSSWAGKARGLEAPEVFRLIADQGGPFLSRGDGSGTHDMELLIWLEAGIDPAGEPWYTESGEGMMATLQAADLIGAGTLAELGAFLAASGLDLVDLGLDHGGLDNPYTAFVVSGATGEGEARHFLDWLTSSEGIDAIERVNLELFGEPVYQPAAETG